MRLALYQPDIPQNTGTILRLAACLGVPVDIVGPTGFDMSDKALRRAALDYIDHVELTRHVDWPAFLAANSTARIALITSHGSLPFTEFDFKPADVILMGRESAGAPAGVHEAAAARLRIPMRPQLRSLNLAVATGIVLAEALRQTGGWPAQ
jgi:tRNA (cytidine/uridine-2'-O-)-methyltransferase